MPVVGFNLTKITAEKKGALKGSLKVDNNAKVESIKETKIDIGKSKQKTIEIEFTFTSTYEPKFATIQIEGTLLFLEEEKVVKEITNEWKKKKKIPVNYIEYILNAILGRCSIEAILLSRELNLPAPFPLPRLRQKVKAEDYVG